jgi:putative ubiquitin-RnfH superfamily antitoxin RatB of RatAB toxin-antitoxin module
VQVELVYCPAPGRIESETLTLDEGACLGDAIAGSTLVKRHDLAGWPAGVWGHARDADTLLRERDRIEFYRPLRVDPKEARRLRYKQRAKR